MTKLESTAQIRELLLQNWEAKAIAMQLNVSIKTVYRHIQNTGLVRPWLTRDEWKQIQAQRR